MKKPSLQDYRLYFVTDPHLHKGYLVIEQVKLALQGGVRVIQIREKELSTPDFSALVAEALRLTRAYDAFLIVNDAVDVAIAAGADGVHLGQEDMPLGEARDLLGSNAVIGISVQTPAQAIDAEVGSADYIAVSGVFPTATKTDVGRYPGLDGVTQIRRSTGLPIIAIGGINPQNCRRVIEAGAHGVAVVTAITMSDDIPGTCRNFLKIVSPCP
jgi:thiamine-phosphate pyrophosphorylase